MLKFPVPLRLACLIAPLRPTGSLELLILGSTGSEKLTGPFSVWRKFRLITLYFIFLMGFHFERVGKHLLWALCQMDMWNKSYETSKTRGCSYLKVPSGFDWPFSTLMGIFFLCDLPHFFRWRGWIIAAELNIICCQIFFFCFFLKNMAAGAPYCISLSTHLSLLDIVLVLSARQRLVTANRACKRQRDRHRLSDVTDWWIWQQTDWQTHTLPANASVRTAEKTAWLTLWEEKTGDGKRSRVLIRLILP